MNLIKKQAMNKIIKDPLCENEDLLKIQRKKTREQPCPFCNNFEINRIPLEIWMNFLPGSNRFVCPNCKGEFITLLGDLVISISEGYSKLTNINLKQSNI